MQNDLNMANKQTEYQGYKPPFILSAKAVGMIADIAAQMERFAMRMEQEYPGIKIVVMGDMNDNPTDESQTVYLHGRENPEDVAPEDFFDPFIRLLKDGYGSLAYRGVWNIYDIIQVNYNLLNAPDGGLKLHPIKLGRKKYFGRVFHKDFMTNQSGPYKGTPFRTFSGGAFIGGYSDHYPTYIIVSK